MGKQAWGKWKIITTETLRVDTGKGRKGLQSCHLSWHLGEWVRYSSGRTEGALEKAQSERGGQNLDCSGLPLRRTPPSSPSWAHSQTTKEWIKSNIGLSNLSSVGGRKVISDRKRVSIKCLHTETSLVVQRLRIHLLIRGTRVGAPVAEQLKPVSHNYCSPHALSLCSATEKPPQWEAHTPQRAQQRRPKAAK